MKRAIAALGLSSLLAMSAHADIDVRASIGGLSFELIDLDPSDGISPSITFGQSWANGNTYLRTAGMYEGRSISYGGAFLETSRSLITGPASSEIKFEGTDVGTFATRASSHSDLNVVEFGQIPQEFASTDWYLDIELSPKTALKISATGKVQASSNLALAAGSFSRLDAYARLEVFTGPMSQIAYNNVSAVNATFSESIEQTLSVTFTNNWSNVQTSTLHIDTYLDHHISPVPEPSSWGLIAGGLLLLGMAAKSRRVR